MFHRPSRGQQPLESREITKARTTLRVPDMEGDFTTSMICSGSCRHIGSNNPQTNVIRRPSAGQIEQDLAKEFISCTPIYIYTFLLIAFQFFRQTAATVDWPKLGSP